MKKNIGCSCHTCHKKVHSSRHFTSEDGRILCYECRIRENAEPANMSALGIKK